MSERPVAGLSEAELEQLIERKVNERVEARLAALEARLARGVEALEGRPAEPRERTLPERASILVFSGDMDRLMSAFIVASGAAAMGLDTSMYFTFWGLTALRKKRVYRGKGVVERVLTAAMPSNPAAAPLSRMNMAGLGAALLGRVMARKNIETLPGLIAVAREAGVRMVACQMSMGVMGITAEELIDGVEFGGVAAYLGDATDAKLTLFV